MRGQALAVVLVLTAAACGSDDDDGGSDTSAVTATTSAETTATTAAGGRHDDRIIRRVLRGRPGPRRAGSKRPAACVEGKTLDPVELTIATGDPAFPPYVIDDTPENGQGFEAAVAYAVAGAMGIGPDAVTWVRTGFEAAIAPGPKEFDFNIQQYGITPEREEAVSFSTPYYTGNQAILGYADSPAASATTIADLKDLRIGVAVGTTSLNFVTDVLKPTEDPFVYNDNAGAKVALDSDQIDAVVADLPTALYITAVEIEGTSVFGQFPPRRRRRGRVVGHVVRQGQPAGRVRQPRAGGAHESGQLEDITTKWMKTESGVPEITLE